jgi:hypothetical protein
MGAAGCGSIRRARSADRLRMSPVARRHYRRRICADQAHPRRRQAPGLCAPVVLRVPRRADSGWLADRSPLSQQALRESGPPGASHGAGELHPQHVPSRPERRKDALQQRPPADPGKHLRRPARMAPVPRVQTRPRPRAIPHPEVQKGSMDISDTLAPTATSSTPSTSSAARAPSPSPRSPRATPSSPCRSTSPSSPACGDPASRCAASSPPAGAPTLRLVGRRVTLYCDESVTFGNDVVGGTRISHLSHIDKRKSIPLLVKRGKSATFTVEPLPQGSRNRRPADRRAQWRGRATR